MIYFFDGEYLGMTEVVKRRKGGEYRYNLYKFRDMHTRVIHYLYDHKCSKELVEVVRDNEKEVFQVMGVITARGMQNFCNLDGLAIVGLDGMKWVYRV